MTDKRPKRPRDTNQLAKSIVDIATGEADDVSPEKIEDRTLLRDAGSKGGVARAKGLSANQRSAIARKAALSRWAAKSDS